MKYAHAHSRAATDEKKNPKLLFFCNSRIDSYNTKHYTEYPCFEKVDFFKNYNPYFEQVSTPPPAWVYHVVTNFRCTPKAVVQHFVHNV